MRTFYATMAASVLLTEAGGLAQTASSGDDNLFPKYPVKVTFHGHPAAPVLTDPDAHSFRTRIREGAAKGPVFADHYAIAGWGCGAPCLSFAIIDSISGKVYIFPYTISLVGEVGEPLSYRRNSRAIHIIGSLNEKNPADRWYV